MNMKTDLPAELPGFFQELVNGPQEVIKPLELNRRGFLKFTGIAGGGLVLGVYCFDRDLHSSVVRLVGAHLALRRGARTVA